MKCLVDADVLLHELGWSSQFKDKDTGEEILFSAERACELLDKKIEVIQEECMSDESPTLYVSSSEWIVKAWNQNAKWNDREEMVHEPNFRYEVGVTKPYKGTRTNPKPVHFKNLFIHMIENYEVVVSSGGLEADDVVCIAQRTAIDAGEDTIVCSRDKDLRIVQGWHYSWECGKQPSHGPVETDSLGYIYMYKDDVRGYGLAFFLAQMIMGDGADNIPGLVGQGKAAAWKLLSPLEGDKKAQIKAVKTLYKEKAGDTSKELFLEQAQLLWMRQRDNEPFDIRKLK